MCNPKATSVIAIGIKKAMAYQKTGIFQENSLPRRFLTSPLPPTIRAASNPARLGEKSTILESKYTIRAPLLRVPQEKMEQMLTKAGFNILEIQYNFAGCPESMLFVAQKKKE